MSVGKEAKGGPALHAGMPQQPGTEMNTTDVSKNAERTSKAGRDLPAAIGVGVGFGVLLVLGLFVQPVLVAVASAAAGLGAWELGQVFNTRRGYGIPALLLGLLSAAIVVCSYAFGFAGLGISLAVSLLVLLLGSFLPRADRTVSAMRSWSGSLLALLWVPLMLGIALVYFQTDRGTYGILMILLMAISNDTFGYIAGVNWGKHPMAPKISPKKSWEGLAGSYIGSALVGSIALAVMGEPWYGALPLAAVMVIASTAGDLTESVFKRRMGVKDMSNILPGHGGMMDRLDSILFAVAAGCLLFTFVIPL